MEVSLNVGIVGALVQVIDRASEKGTFTGQDITTVGQLRAQLVAKLQEVEDNKPEGELADKVED